jgi:tetratricopeptide (TPR) repeat protein
VANSKALEYHELGIALLKENEIKKALEMFRKATELDPDFLDAYLLLGYCSANLELFPEAEQSLEYVLSKEPESLPALQNMGALMLKLNQFDRSIQYYDKYVHLDQKNADVWKDRGNAIVASIFNLERSEHTVNKYKDALDSFSKGLEIKQDMPEALKWKCICLTQIDEYSKAINCFRSFLEKYPPDSQTLFYYGYSLEKEHSYQEALKVYDETLRLSHESKTDSKLDIRKALSNKALVLTKLRRFKESLTILDQLTNEDPGYVNGWLNKAGILFELGKQGEALKSINNAIKLQPNIDKAWYNKGTILLKQKNYEKAISSFDKAIEINEKNFDAYFNKGAALEALDKYKEALECFNSYLSGVKNSYEGLIKKGMMLLELEKYSESIICFRHAMTINSERVEAPFYIGLTQYRMKKYDDAIKYYDISLTKANDPAIWTDKGLVYHDLGLYDEAIISYKKAEKILENEVYKDSSKNKKMLRKIE